MKLALPFRNPAEHQLNGCKNALLGVDKHACTDRMYRRMQQCPVKVAISLPLLVKLHREMLQRWTADED